MSKCIQATYFGSLPNVLGDAQPCELLFLPNEGDEVTATATIIVNGVGHAYLTFDSRALVHLARVAKRILVDLAEENIPS